MDDNVSSTSSRRRGASVRIFLVDGTPDGLRIVEKSNWTGVATMCSRAQYPSVRSRDEFARPGVYLLLGPNEQDPSRQSIYIGQADIARDRLDQHLSGKDFWTRFILFSSKDSNLNKAHVQYLEARLIKRAMSAKRDILDNGNAPRLPSLSEADRADADSFLDDMLSIYPLLGVTSFEIPTVLPNAVPAIAPTPGDPPVELALDSTTQLFLRSSGAEASGRETPDGFVVFRGATGRAATQPSAQSHQLKLRQQLLESGVLALQGDLIRLMQDYAFESPTTAAAVFVGRPANGRVEWKDANGRTLKQIQEAAIGALPGK